MRRLLWENTAVKIASIVLALFLWAVVNGQREVVRQIDVPLALPGLPDSLVYLEHPGESVSVTFRAPAGRLFWFRVAPPVLEPVFFVAVTETTQTIMMKQEFLDLPRQFEGSVVDFSPDFIKIRLSEVGEMELPVIVEVGRGPTFPWKLRAQPHASPARVVARGPSQRIAYLRNRRVRTEPLDLQGLEGIVTLEAKLMTPDPLVQILPDRVIVEVVLERSGVDGRADLDLDSGSP